MKKVPLAPTLLVITIITPEAIAKTYRNKCNETLRPSFLSFSSNDNHESDSK
ncbi:hypothetical protein J6590_093183 [Homalodisca vitripennis]|nr:hypothetical protein J6590_092338 [Homalodisca vitripennis]KAG8304458.1 hypothetical protein J6590_093183 [Homalodisca vitripennis]